MYSLNGKNITSYGLIPGHSQGSNIAMKGIFDLPARIGQTYYEWAESPIEPYVDSQEIFMSGKDLTFTGSIIGTSKQVNDYLQLLYDDIELYTGLVSLVTPYGTFQVQVKTITPEFYTGGCSVIIVFREPVVTLSGGVLPGGVFNDWFLGSLDEMKSMRKNLWSGLDDNGITFTPVGGFLNVYYWTSSEYTITPTLAEAVSFLDGVSYQSSKGVLNRVRAVREIWSSTDVYNFRDIGPAGGHIFHITDNLDGTFNYLESAPSDQSTGKAWSNITDAIGLTETAINDGRRNTQLITAQAFHIDSAAKLCEDLSLGTLSAGGNYTVDGISFDLFGLYYSKGSGLRNLAELKEQLFTKYGSEGYQMSKRKNRTFDINAVLIASDLADFQAKVKSLYLLFSSSGMRSIIINNEINIECFAVDGFTIDDVYLLDTGVVANFNINLICTKVSLLTADSTLISVDNTAIMVDAA